MKITFHGAARTTTGSMHLLDMDGKLTLLDCGLYQGRRKEAFERNRTLPFDANTIDQVVLSHAHIDHSGNLPTLVHNGFKGKIFCTPATRDLCDIMLRDSAYLQERDVEYVNKKRARQGKTLFEPLYTQKDIDPTLDLFESIPYGSGFEVAQGVTAAFHDAGHILGSAITTFDFKVDGQDKRLLFTGDMGRVGMPILRDPQVVTDVNYLITESTYGNRLHPPEADVKEQLKDLFNDIVENKSKLIIPAFSVGRTQQIVYFLNELFNEDAICCAPVYVDSPLSSKATAVHEDHPECYDEEAFGHMIKGDKPFEFGNLTYITDVEDSKKLNETSGPAVIISASGMCEGGRILHHLKNNIEDPKNIILIVGYQAEHTLGRRIVEGANPIKIFGEEYELNARVKKINALSAHADRDELLTYFRAMGPEVERAFVVHGEDDQCSSFAKALTEIGANNVVIPSPGETYSIP